VKLGDRHRSSPIAAIAVSLTSGCWSSLEFPYTVSQARYFNNVFEVAPHSLPQPVPTLPDHVITAAINAIDKAYFAYANIPTHSRIYIHTMAEAEALRNRGESAASDTELSGQEGTNSDGIHEHGGTFDDR
jgi:hypothetical protein